MRTALVDLVALASISSLVHVEGVSVNIPRLSEVDTSVFSPELRDAILEPQPPSSLERPLDIDRRKPGASGPHVPLRSGDYLVSTAPILIPHRLAHDRPHDPLASRTGNKASNPEPAPGSVLAKAKTFFLNKDGYDLRRWTFSSHEPLSWRQKEAFLAETEGTSKGEGVVGALKGKRLALTGTLK